MTRQNERETPREPRDPAEDPRVCSRCGVYRGMFPDGEFCDSCARELGTKPPLRRCIHCGDRYPEEQMEAFDVSADGEYYPEFRFLCFGCQSDDSSDEDGGKAPQGDDS